MPYSIGESQIRGSRILDIADISLTIEDKSVFIGTIGNSGPQDGQCCLHFLYFPILFRATKPSTTPF